MRILLTAIISLVLLNVSAQKYEALKERVHPSVGKRFNINYVTDSTTLSTAKEVSATVYFYDGLKQSGTAKFRMEKRAGGWRGSVKIPDSAVMTSLVFSSGDGNIVENNHGKGYLLPVFKQGKPIQFAYACMANLLGSGPPDAAKLKKDHKRALVFMKEEMRLHPESEASLRSQFYNMLANSPEREDKVDLLKRLNSFKSNKEEDLMMAQLYLSYFGGKKQADSLDKLLVMNFPNGNYVKEKRLRAERLVQKTVVDKPVKTPETAISKEELLKNVQGNLVNEPVRPIQLKDINGNSVVIGADSLKGKVIILDFWATWCKPCIASFPAMQKVIDRYRNNSAVKFFFIATMEQGDALKNVKQFMAKTDYSFNVLLDEKTDDMNLYKAYSNYKVEGGIPYKLVMDGNGHIRARSKGFSGSEEELITELSAMIDIALKSTK